MNSLYRTPSPLSSPVGTPSRFYSPTNTPTNTPYGSLGSSRQHHRRSNESLNSAIADKLSAVSTDANANARTEQSGGIIDESDLPATDRTLPKIEEDAEEDETTNVINSRCPFSNRDILTMCTLCFCTGCSSMFGSLLAPFFPTEAVKKGVSQTWIGLIFGSFQLVSFIMCPVWGHYIAKIGAKFMYVSGMCVCGSCAILFGMLEWCPPGMIYIIMCFCTRTLESVSSAACSTANMAIATYTFPQHVSTVIGILNACSCIGLMVGPPIGGILFEAGGFYLPFLVTGSTFVTAGVVSVFLLPSPKDPPVDEKQNTEAEKKIPKWKLLKVPMIPIAGYLTLIGQFAIGYIDVVFTIHLNKKFNLSPTVIGLIFLIAPLVVVVLAPSCGAIADKYPAMARPIMIFGALISAAGFAGLGPSFIYPFLPEGKLWVVLLSLAVAGVGWGAIVVTYQEFNNAARRRGFPHTIETQGLVAGVYNAFSNLGAFLGPVVGGALNEHTNFVFSSTIVAAAIAYASLQMLIYVLIEKLCCDEPPLPRDDPKAEDTEKLLINSQDNVQSVEQPIERRPADEYRPIGNQLLSHSGGANFSDPSSSPVVNAEVNNDNTVSNIQGE